MKFWGVLLVKCETRAPVLNDFVAFFAVWARLEVAFDWRCLGRLLY